MALSLAHSSYAFSTWRVRVTSSQTTWALTELRFFKEQNCTSPLSVLDDDVFSSGVSAPGWQASTVHPKKAVDGSVTSYWKGAPDNCGALWLAVNLEVESPGCVEIYQSYGVDVERVSVERYVDSDWLYVADYGGLAKCPKNVYDCCPSFDSSSGHASGCTDELMGVTTIVVDYSSLDAFDPAPTCKFPSMPPPLPPQPYIPPRPSPQPSPPAPPFAPPGMIWVWTTVPEGKTPGECYIQEMEEDEDDAQSGTISICVPDGASPGDVLYLTAKSIFPPAPPPETPIIDVEGMIADGENDSAYSAVTGLAVSLGVAISFMMALLMYVLVLKRKQRANKAQLADATKTIDLYRIEGGIPDTF